MNLANNKPDSAVLPFTAINSSYSGVVNKSQLFNSIRVVVKTFYGRRSLEQLTVKINENVGNLLEYLKEIYLRNEIGDGKYFEGQFYLVSTNVGD